MPTYEYECRSCEKTFDVFQSMSDAPLAACPTCGGKVRRLIGGGTGIIFKGSGFYVNDSRRAASSSSSKPAASAAKGEGGSAGSGDSGGGEAKNPPSSPAPAPEGSAKAKAKEAS